MTDTSGGESDHWGDHANCYAYAAKCDNPTFIGGKPSGAIPGLAKGKGAKSNGNLADYVKALTAGVEADGGSFAGDDASEIPEPTEGKYLIAGLANQYGFHFVRRDPASREWSWVDGNHSPVKNQLIDVKSEKPVKATEALMKQVFAGNATGKLTWFYSGMSFYGYFWIPAAGLKVSGP